MSNVEFENGYYTVKIPEGVGMFPESMYKAVKEYEEAKASYIRSPYDPDILLYDLGSDRVVRIVDLQTGFSYDYFKESLKAKKAPKNIRDAVEWYFTKIKPETKPWHSAKPGEFWKLTIDGYGDYVAIVYDYKTFKIVSKEKPYAIYRHFDSEGIIHAEKLDWQ